MLWLGQISNEILVWQIVWKQNMYHVFCVKKNRAALFILGTGTWEILYFKLNYQ